jgi:hypothetical protein
MQRLTFCFTLLSLTLLPALSSQAQAMSKKVPKGSWKCSFQGQEWQRPSGPHGQTQLWPRLYTSAWQMNKNNAYAEALEQCKTWSDTYCNYSSCQQKK